MIAPDRLPLALVGLGLSGAGFLVLRFGPRLVRRNVEHRRRNGYPKALVNYTAFVGMVLLPIAGAMILLLGLFLFVGTLVSQN